MNEVGHSLLDQRREIAEQKPRICIRDCVFVTISEKAKYESIDKYRCTDLVVERLDGSCLTTTTSTVKSELNHFLSLRGRRAFEDVKEGQIHERVTSEFSGKMSSEIYSTHLNFMVLNLNLNQHGCVTFPSII